MNHLSKPRVQCSVLFVVVDSHTTVPSHDESHHDGCSGEVGDRRPAWATVSDPGRLLSFRLLACCLPSVLRLSPLSLPLCNTIHFLFYRVRACFLVCFCSLDFFHPPSRGVWMWRARGAQLNHSHVFSPCDSMTSSHLTSSLC
jgi:hypothetical protein